MSILEVSPVQLKAKAEQLRGLNNNFKNEVTNLENIEVSLKSKWTGDANDKFHKKFVDDKAKMDSFTNLIEKYIQSMITIADLYEKTENCNYDVLNTRRY